MLRRFIDRPSSRPAQNAAVRRVRTALFRAGTGLGLVNLPLTAYNLVRLPDAYRFGFGWLSCAILAVELAWCAQQCVTREPDLLPMRVVVATSYLVLSLHPLVLSPDFRGYPPLLHVLGAGMSLTALGFGPMAATLGVPAFAAYVGVLRTPVLGPGPAAIEASLQSLGGLVVAATVFLLERAASQVEQAVEANGWPGSKPPERRGGPSSACGGTASSMTRSSAPCWEPGAHPRDRFRTPLANWPIRPPLRSPATRRARPPNSCRCGANRLGGWAWLRDSP